MFCLETQIINQSVEASTAQDASEHQKTPNPQLKAPRSPPQKEVESQSAQETSTKKKVEDLSETKEVNSDLEENLAQMVWQKSCNIAYQTSNRI